MRKFARRFPVKELKEWDKEHSGNAVRRLFDRWVLPGLHVTAGAMLRVGVRDGYLNFYVKGQSVAKLSYGSSGPTIETHKKYIEGRRRRRRGEDVPAEQVAIGYISLPAAELVKPKIGELIAGWIETAETYATAEKRFVDELIGHNAGVIDLEMGLPAGEAGDTAPRMDLVMAQTGPGNAAQIAFWEAKCSNNSELRAAVDYEEEKNGRYVRGPRVIHQLRKYQNWVGQHYRMKEVQYAYKDAANVLLALAEAFGKTDASCLPIWRGLAETETPEVVLPPGVIIGNYCPQGHAPAKTDVFGQQAKSFGPHKEKLLRHGIAVHEVDAGHLNLLLPPLHPGSVIA